MEKWISDMLLLTMKKDIPVNHNENLQGHGPQKVAAVVEEGEMGRKDKKDKIVTKDVTYFQIVFKFKHFFHYFLEGRREGMKEC